MQIFLFVYMFMLSFSSYDAKVTVVVSFGRVRHQLLEFKNGEKLNKLQFEGVPETPTLTHRK